MTQSIDPVKLKASAEHLDWVLKQYPDSEDVQSLLRALSPLIEAAKAGRVLEPVGRRGIPGAYNFGDGVYTPYRDPDVDEAYSEFSAEMRGGRDEEENEIIASVQAMLDGAKARD